MVLNSQVTGVEFHVTNFFREHLLHLVAVLLVLVPASLLRLVGADQPVLHNTHWLQRLLLTLVTDLPGLLLAVLGVLYFLAFFGRVFISSSQIFLGSKWQFCSSTGKGKMLENFSQYLCTSVLQTSTWIFLGML